MGRRSTGETIAAIYQAFLVQRTWVQAELARRIGIGPPALRRRLAELSESGMPLLRDDDPPHVYWSVRATWFPGGVALERSDAVELVRELYRLPRSEGRDRILRKLLGGMPADNALEGAGDRIIPPVRGEQEAAYLAVAEDSSLQRTALHIRYFSASRGDIGGRHVSVQTVLPGPPARFVAVCHRRDDLRWFRLDNVMAARLDASVPFREAAPEAVERFIEESADGFREEEKAAEHAFFVPGPEARWVRKNLIEPMRVEETGEGIRVVARTAGALRVARFVVSLGDAARVETEPLRALVAELAEGALRATRRDSAVRETRASSPEAMPLNRDAVGSIRSRG